MARSIAAPLVLSALLVFGGAYAASPEPPKSKAGAAAQPSAPDKRGTDEVPFTVKLLPAPDAEAKAAEQQAEKDKKAIAEADKTILDAALVKWTRYLFGAT